MMTELQFRDPGEVPVLDWIDKTLIDIDTAYQRGLDEAGCRRSSTGSPGTASVPW